MRRTIFALLVLFTATTAHGEITINGAFPAEGPVRGGTIVRITGSGFSTNCIICSPPFGGPPTVFFGGTESPSVTFIDENNLDAVTPPHLPGAVSITVRQMDGSMPATRQNVFTFTGEPLSAFDAVLFPIFLPLTDGAFGSRFETSASVGNRGQTQAVHLYGRDASCYISSPLDVPENPVILGADRVLLTGCSRSTGRLFYAPRQETAHLAANLRVADISRQASSLGVEIPVVVDDDFSDERITLLTIPYDPRYRYTLRVYSVARTDMLVDVQINGFGVAQLALTPGRDIFEPSFASFTDFPRPQDLPPGATSFRVTVDTPRGPGGVVPSNAPKIWAFISITNNETQEITTVTPRP